MGTDLIYIFFQISPLHLRLVHARATQKSLLLQDPHNCDLAWIFKNLKSLEGREWLHMLGSSIPDQFLCSIVS